MHLNIRSGPETFIIPKLLIGLKYLLSVFYFEFLNTFLNVVDKATKKLF